MTELSTQLSCGQYESQYAVDELIEELADERVPVNRDQVLDLAQREWWLVETEPETASIGNNSPLDLISLNIMEHIRNELTEWYYTSHQI